MDKQEKLKEIEEKVRNLDTDLAKQSNNPVPGEGDFDAEIVFIGEAPGFNEDKQGRPFVGRAGKILDELLESIGLKREDIFITNIVKHRPPGNRNPTNEEIRKYSPFLDEQLEVIKPKVICCLGNFSSKYILEKYGLNDKIDGITKIRGEVFKISTLQGLLKIIPLFHPAVATYDPNKLDTLKKDFQILKEETGK